jgi:hypothetical protein
LVLLLPDVEEPDVPVVAEPLPVERLVVEPEPVVPDVEPRLESGDAEGEPPSLRAHAVTPTAITSAKNTERAFIISHLLRSVLPR